LRQSLVRIADHRRIQRRKPLQSFFNFFHQIKALIGKREDGRTRGIEISVLTDDDITISIWDLAGQEEFHAFHDYMMPNFGDIVIPCSFLFVFDPIIHKEHHERNHHRKYWKELEEDLLYWLRFIASNTPTSTTFRPQLNVILTHADKDLDASGLCIWVESNVLSNLRKQFENVVDISTEIHAINALSTKHVQPVLDFVFKSFRDLLAKTPLVFEESARLQHALAEESKRCPNRPLMSWSAFCQLCAQTIPKVYYVKNEADNDEPFDLVKSKERARVLAAHLHDIGNIIYFPGLEWVVVNPNWFCHDIMGYVINFRDTQHYIDDKGFATKDHIEHILNQSLSMVSKHTPSGSNPSLGPIDLLQFMLHLNICYEKEPGNLDAGVFIPATLEANSSIDKIMAISEGKRKLHWPIPTSQAPKETIFLGRRLECNDPFHTFLTPGFFPRLQVMYQYILIPCISKYFELITHL
jgi:GTPase SAR1 family protein